MYTNSQESRVSLAFLAALAVAVIPRETQDLVFPSLLQGL